MQPNPQPGAHVVWSHRWADRLPGAALFAAALALAWLLDWQTTDLLWSTWFTGVVVGYAALMIGVIGEWRRNRGAPYAGAVATGSAMLFSVHFLGFNWLVAFWLQLIAPVGELRGGFWTAQFWTVLATRCWPMLLLTDVNERRMLFDVLQRFDTASPYLPAIRTWAIYLPLFFIVLLGDLTGLFTVDHIACYTLVALAYFSPWRIELAAEPAAP